MKKYLIYSGVLIIGLFFGWLLFGNSTEKTPHNHDEVSKTNEMWTCSMHPQILLPEAGDCPICGMDLIPAESSADGLSADQFKLTKNAIALANIQTTKIGGSVVNDKIGIKLSGKIVENEENNTIQISYFSGRIEHLNVSFTGEKVEKGQLLATIYSPELLNAQQELLTAYSLKESQPALYKAVRNKLKLWKLSEEQINSIEASGKVKENFPIYATVSGTVSEKLVEQGASIKKGQPLLRIANLNTVWANFDVYENQIELFKVGQRISIRTTSFPTKEFKTRVSFIDPTLDTKTRTVTLRGVLNNRTRELKPGMFIEGSINSISSEITDNVSIPASAVLWTGKRSIVYIKPNPNESVFEMREVLLGNKVGENYQVAQGLTVGDEIVTNGAFTVDAAAQLQGKKSMMNKEGGKTMTGHEGHMEMNTNATKNTTTHEMDTKRLKVDSRFQSQLKKVFDEYIILKNALIKDDVKISISASSKMLKNLASIDMKLVKGDAHNSWMLLSGQLKQQTRSLNSTTDIKKQRNHFKPLSASLIMAVEKFGINQQVYRQFCPMADGNKGGSWLSLEDKVLNPYYGDAMLTCGEITKTIK
ncbi:MAG: efflux RND transporter periplasmic adaptor subunit [Flavobacteriaceae bacterium]|nr:efflux RND transporter periplasmic adaptor subunit [Flavobacteriaceae bacterium]